MGAAAWRFVRALGEQRLVVVFNASAMRRQVRLNAKQIGWRDGLILTNLLTDEQIDRFWRLAECDAAALERRLAHVGLNRSDLGI